MSDVLKVLKIARALGECNLTTFKTSRVTINPEMHDQVHTIFYLLYIQQNYSVADVFDCELFMLVFFSFFSFSRPCLPNIQPGLCSFQRVFVVLKRQMKLNLSFQRGGGGASKCNFGISGEGRVQRVTQETLGHGKDYRYW